MKNKMATRAILGILEEKMKWGDGGGSKSKIVGYWEVQAASWLFAAAFRFQNGGRGYGYHAKHGTNGGGRACRLDSGHAMPTARKSSFLPRGAVSLSAFSIAPI